MTRRLEFLHTRATLWRLWACEILPNQFGQLYSWSSTPFCCREDWATASKRSEASMWISCNRASLTRLWVSVTFYLTMWLMGHVYSYFFCAVLLLWVCCDCVKAVISISVVLFLSQGYALLMPSVGSSLAIVTAAASTCLFPDLRWALITGLKSLFSSFVVSQLVAKPEPLGSECLKEEILM